MRAAMELQMIGGTFAIGGASRIDRHARRRYFGPRSSWLAIGALARTAAAASTHRRLHVSAAAEYAYASRAVRFVCMTWRKGT
jgi:hypothetical protein